MISATRGRIEWVRESKGAAAAASSLLARSSSLQAFLRLMGCAARCFIELVNLVGNAKCACAICIRRAALPSRRSQGAANLDYIVVFFFIKFPRKGKAHLILNHYSRESLLLIEICLRARAAGDIAVGEETPLRRKCTPPVYWPQSAKY